MMGSPYYYDVHFDPVDVVFHDCMWSGTCCIQLVQQQPDHLSHQITLSSSSATAIAATVAATSATLIAHDDYDTPARELMLASPTTTSAFSPTSSLATSSLANDANGATCAQLNETKVVRTGVHGSTTSGTTTRQLSTTQKRVKVRLLGTRKVPSKLHHLKQQQQPHTRSQQQQQQQSNADLQQHEQPHSSTSNCGPTAADPSNSTSSLSPCPSSLNQSQSHCASSGRSAAAADNKKLRHREVEKNRHRQLQAMVKTLSDRIPGKIEKETQVQTMKRAAKYCLYLRDVLTHGQHMGKDKLERFYLRSCENVDLMMAHDEQACASPSITSLSPRTKCED